MGIFKTYSLNKIVPVDSSIQESYIIRCLKNAIQSKDAVYLTSALISLTISLEFAKQHVSADVLLDILVPILHTKCNLSTLTTLLERVNCSLQGDANGATGYSLCLFQSASIVACKLQPTTK